MIDACFVDGDVDGITGIMKKTDELVRILATAMTDISYLGKLIE